MPTRRLALFAVLALVAMPSSALAQSAGDDQYTNPLPQTQAPSNSGSGGGSGNSGSGSGSGSGSSSGAGTTAGTTQTNSGTTSSDSTGTSSDSSGSSSGETLPRTGLPLGVLAGLGLLFTFAGRRLRRASEDPVPDPYADRNPDVPASSPAARARRRSD